MRRNMFALQLALAAGPLIGWGVTDLHGFAESVVRIGVVIGAIASCTIVSALETPRDPFAAGVHAPSRARSVLLRLGILSVPLLLGCLASADRRGVLVTRDSGALRVTGLALYLGGEALRIAALRALGPQYSAYVTVQRGHELVRTGIYRVIRHPIYLAQVVAVPGLAMAFRSVLALPLLLVSLLFVSRRIAHEEKLLGETFPAFSEYRRSTWRLLPYVY